jgi:hypothetical protein
LVSGSGSHDEAYLAHGDEWDIYCPDASNDLAFSKGIPCCIGMPLARLIEYIPTLSFRGPKQIQIEWDCAPTA